MNPFRWLFDWKRHPGRVFILAIPLALSAMSMMLWVAIAHARYHGDYWYLAIWGAGMLVLACHPAIWLAVRAAHFSKPVPGKEGA
jgi:hypothetical protein